MDDYKQSCSSNILGTQNLRDKGIMTHWHGQERVEYWREPSKDEVGNSKAALSCNLVEGRDPGTWPTDIDVTSVLEAFVGPLCRKLEMRFVKKVCSVCSHTYGQCTAAQCVFFSCFRFQARTPLDLHSQQYFFYFDVKKLPVCQMDP